MGKTGVTGHDSHDGNSQPEVSDIIEQLGQSDGSSGQFLMNVLAAHCYLIRADRGAILRSNQSNGIDVLAVHPGIGDSGTAPQWVRHAAKHVQEAISANAAISRLLPDNQHALGDKQNRYALLAPLAMDGVGRIIEAAVVEGCSDDEIEETLQQFELSARLYGACTKHLAVVRKDTDLDRLKKAMDVLSAMNLHNRFKSASMAFCNEVASQWQAERVSLGLLKSRCVRLKAMSHTEDFGRKMKTVQDIESTMEECLDQDCEVLHPAVREATYVSRAVMEMSKQHGPLAVLSLPLRQDGEVLGVLTLERPTEKPFNNEEVETIRLTCDLCTARLLNLHEHDRWIGARLAASIRKMLAFVVGPKHTWAKILAIAICGAVAFLIFAKGQFKAEAPFVFEATQQQVVCAPFDGYIKAVEVEIGDIVRAKEDVLGELDTAELRLQLAAAKAEKAGYLKQYAAAMRDGETAQAQIAEANADKVEAQINLLDYKIEQAKVVSPLSGTVVTGDLKRQIGAPVKTGDVLFEVTPLESLQAELMVAEDEVFDIRIGQEGALATASYPGDHIRLIVERINPMAEVVNNRNVFKVRARLLETRQWMRPGMEGVAKVEIGKRRYVWIWTRKIINWLRMKLWV